MKLLRSTCIAALLIVGTVSTAAAQDAMTNTLKDKAADMAVDKAKSEVKSQVKDAVNNPVADKAIDIGADMAKGTSMKDAAQDVMMDEVKSNAKGMATARMPGGGTIKTSAPQAPAVIMHESYNESTATENTVMDAPQPLPAPVSTPAVTQSGIPTNCPSGTTGQPDGTCMITGNYSG